MKRVRIVVQRGPCTGEVSLDVIWAHVEQYAKAWGTSPAHYLGEQLLLAMQGGAPDVDVEITVRRYP